MEDNINERVRKMITQIGQDLINRAEDISKDLNKCSSITIHAEILWDCALNFDITKNYYVFPNTKEECQGKEN